MSLNRYHGHLEQIRTEYRLLLGMISVLPDTLFIGLLIQQSQISVSFIAWLDRARLPMQNTLGRSAITELMRDELPHNRPSHQEDRVADLRKLGLSDDKIFGILPTTETITTIGMMFRLLDWGEQYDLRACVVVQAMEMLAGEFYDRICHELERRFEFTEPDSRFYWRHYRHDSHEAGSASHGAVLEPAITELLQCEADLDAAIQTLYCVLEVREGYLKQFIN